MAPNSNGKYNKEQVIQAVEAAAAAVANTGANVGINRRVPNYNGIARRMLLSFNKNGKQSTAAPYKESSEYLAETLTNANRKEINKRVNALVANLVKNAKN
jgi:hypothetical protein